jgi:hypothetical protein
MCSQALPLKASPNPTAPITDPLLAALGLSREPEDPRTAVADWVVERPAPEVPMLAAGTDAVEARRLSQELSGSLKERETLIDVKRRAVADVEATVRAQAPDLVDNPAAIEARLGLPPG